MVVPNDALKLAIDCGTPRRRVCASMFSGMLAALERLVKAKVSTGHTLRKKRSGLTPVAARMMPCTTNINPRPRYDTTTKLPSLRMSSVLELATTLVINASTP
ncbi:hypothetical protein D3C76_1236210 [compost metagenome]